MLCDATMNEIEEKKSVYTLQMKIFSMHTWIRPTPLLYHSMSHLMIQIINLRKQAA
jgi:hypothetical protein